MQLSNFYNDFTYDQQNFEILSQIYSGLFSDLTNYVTQVKNNVILPRMETYRMITTQRVDISSAQYSLSALLEDTAVVKKLGFENLSSQEKINKWQNNEITYDDKISVLNLIGKYLDIFANRETVNESNSYVIDFEMVDEITNFRLVKNIDYIFINNRIYLFRNISSNLYPSKYVTLNNIFVDFNTVENRIGKNIHVLYNDKITKNEYAEIAPLLALAALGGPTIKNLKKAVTSITGFNDAQIYDKYVRNLKKQSRWHNYKMTPFDFVVVFPEQYSADINRLTILIDYLKIVKPSFAKFFVILQSLYSDVYNRLLKTSDVPNLDIIYELLSDIYDNSIVIDTYNLEIVHELLSEMFENNITDTYNFDNISELSQEQYSQVIDEWEIGIIRDGARHSRLNSDDRLNVNFILDVVGNIYNSDIYNLSSQASDIYVDNYTDVMTDVIVSNFQDELIPSSLNFIDSDNYDAILSEFSIESIFVENDIVEIYNSGIDISYLIENLTDIENDIYTKNIDESNSDQLNFTDSDISSFVKDDTYTQTKVYEMYQGSKIGESSRLNEDFILTLNDSTDVLIATYLY